MTFADLTAVCIDDSPIQAYKIGSVLAGIGVRVIGKACDGDKGITMLEKLRPTIALIDIVMPLVLGVDVVKAIVAKQLPTLPIMCSSMHLVDLEAQCAALGATHFIIKPYDEILTALELKAMLTEVFSLT